MARRARAIFHAWASRDAKHWVVRKCSLRSDDSKAVEIGAIKMKPLIASMIKSL